MHPALFYQVQKQNFSTNETDALTKIKPISCYFHYLALEASIKKVKLLRLVHATLHNSRYAPYLPHFSLPCDIARVTEPILLILEIPESKF